MGIRLHRLFEKASTREDIFSALDDMAINGELSSSDHKSLKEQITSTLDNSVAGEWFDGEWDNRYCERTIIRPDAPSKRPDRVMTSGDKAIVVDYKFGEEEQAHHRQVANYMKELQQMGYNSVKGYIWYVPTGNIIEIEGL
jgi:hypothetical protein